MRFCSEIEYETDTGNVHSDTCHACHTQDGAPLGDKHREFYHALLDEWLDNSNGTGIFYVGDIMKYVRNNA